MRRTSARLTAAILLLCLCPAAVRLSRAAGSGRTEDMSVRAAGHVWHCQLHIPASLNRAKPAALVLVLHGAGGSGKMYLDRCGWAEKSDKAGFIAAAPDGLPALPAQPPSFVANPRLWNSGQLLPGSPRGRVDDLAFFRALLKDIQGRYSVDPKRMFVTGHSNGAGMAFRLGAEMAGTFAAIAPVASHCWVPNPKPSRPVPTLFIIGTRDKLVPVDGGVSKTPWNTRTLPPVAESLAKWASAIGCSAKPELVSDSNGVRIVRYPSATGGATLTACYVSGQGHNWPGGERVLPEALVGPSNPSFSATDPIWDFFSKQRLP